VVNKRDDLREILRHGSGQWPDPELTDAIVEFVELWMLDTIEDADVIVARWRDDMKWRRCHRHPTASASTATAKRQTTGETDATHR
jgi:hypothetical protein